MTITKLLGCFAVMGFMTAACGGISSLGSGDDKGGLGNGGSAGSGAYEPCENKVCGAECSVCDPADAECVETRSVKYCTEQGECTDMFPGCSPPPGCGDDSGCAVPEICQVCPDGSCAGAIARCIEGQCTTEWETCAGSQCSNDMECPSIGAPCQACPDGTASCPSTRCENGACVTDWPGCAGWDPCANQPCGSECSLCDPMDPTCAEDAVLKFCDDGGRCQPSFPMCGGPGGDCKDSGECAVPASCQVCPDGTCAGAVGLCIDGQCQVEWETCAGSTCMSDGDCPVTGAPCEQCPDGQVSCPSSRCEGGACVTEWAGCGSYEPCGGKVCGDRCTLCEPTDPMCTETAVLKFCDDAGRCQPNFGSCGGSGGQCTSAMDCPQTEACLACPGGGCAEIDCIDGSCESVCR